MLLIVILARGAHPRTIRAPQCIYRVVVPIGNIGYVTDR